MIQADVPPIPASIWQYGCEYLMTPRWLTESTKRLHFRTSENGQEVPDLQAGRYIPRALL